MQGLDIAVLIAAVDPEQPQMLVMSMAWLDLAQAMAAR
jgi:hypothetical protein